MRFKSICLIFCLSIFHFNSRAADSFTYLSVLDAATTAATSSSSSTDTINNPFSGQNNIYDQIFQALNQEYVHTGELLAKKVLNDWTVTGGLNSVGFNYNKAFIDFGVDLSRSLAPDLFSSTRYIVTDTLTISVDASKILNKLKNQNAIDISESNLALFAGIVFQRKFTWIHYANSYDEGLSTHFEKLFFPFRGIQFDTLKSLGADEIITKEDSLSVNAGGFVSGTIYTGITGMAGVLAKLQKVSKLEITRQSSVEGAGDSLLLSYEKSKVATTGISLAIQADLLKILKMTLFSYDFTYDLETSYTIYTKFLMSDLAEMSDSNPVALEIKELIKSRSADVTVLAPYIISEEKKLAETITHKYNFLLLGGSKSAKTQQIEVTSNGVSKNFFRHYYEKIKYTEDFVSRLFASFIYAITNSNMAASTVASQTKKVTIEYDSTQNLIDGHSDINIEKSNDVTKDTQVLSLAFYGEYTTKKTTGYFGKKYKERAKFLIEKYSGVDPLVLDMIDRDTLVAPYTVVGQYQVNVEGIRNFNELAPNSVFDIFSSLCDDKPKTTFYKFRSLFDNCKRSLQNNYIDYLKDLSHDKVTADAIDTCDKKSKKYIFSPGKKRAFLKNCLAELTYKDRADWVQVPLYPLKNLSQDIVNNSESKAYYYELFGQDNVFFYGNFEATTSSGKSFVTYFHKGIFGGLGVVDSFMRQENLRSPASVVVDQ
jgi:hypothetical protein